jgi:3-deoxy-D-manno-octulosonate 8-phosphate phosphatase (KDO 8-P phosphatase)
VADASPEVRLAAHFVTRAPGGFGAVREVIEWILQAQGKWQPIVERFRNERV